MAETIMLKVKAPKNLLRAASLIALGALAACGSTGGATFSDLMPVDAAQGSAENIASLTAVIDRTPNNPGAYNVRGAAYGRAGRYKEALKDFDKAISLDPRSYQSYANRALIHRYTGNQNQAIADYTQAISLNQNYDTAYIGRGELYRLAGRSSEAFKDFETAIGLDTTDPRAYLRRGLLYQASNQHPFAIEGHILRS